ncbi:DUF397 domain-containing protein [Kribbella sp. DT2]|uniref:DUF397 domain-containing protein n=1 Tax=Kribbella sp. DT2 TaxID=3393427 RepID=UPI003CE9DDEA
MMSPDRPGLSAFTNWRKATLSADDNACVEVASEPNGWRAVRDSTDPHGPVLMFTPKEWAAFLDGAHKGEFDL